MNATNMRKVLCVQGMPKAGLDLFAARDDIEVEIVHEGPGFDLRAHLGDIHGITLFGTRYTRELIAATPSLEVCSRFGVGFDSVDVPALTERGVPLMVAGTANSVTVAEHAMFMMLDLAKMARQYHAGVAAGNFGVRNEYSALDLYEKRLLSVGFGRIGSRTVKRALGFEMDVQVYDPYADPAAVRAAGAEPVDDLDKA
ncbi:MAG: 3-phosphoglycerate dehydrogenase, partial [Alphaproteobacteria bacterium]|nr:3-phosphoglycerate dehydrogenase [Alphaproteobacteria bacterium]